MNLDEQLAQMREEHHRTHTYQVYVSDPDDWNEHTTIQSALHWDAAKKLEQLLNRARNACMATPFATSWANYLACIEMDGCTCPLRCLDRRPKTKRRRKQCAALTK